MRQDIRLHIRGMSCQACALRIEKILNKQEFVDSASVSFAGEEARVVFDAATAGEEDIIGLIRKAGFDAEKADIGLPENGVEGRPWRVWLLLLLCLPFAVGMAGMAAGRHDLMPPLAVQWLLASVVQFGLMRPFYRGAWAALRGGSANMDVLVSVGTAAVYLYSSAVFFRPDWFPNGRDAVHGGVYFEVGVMVAAFVSLGKYWEGRTKRGSLNSLTLLMKLTPRRVLCLRGGEWREADLAEVVRGDVLRTAAGGRVATDGEVLAGSAWADESHLNGESLPLHKSAGSRVAAGSLIEGGVLEYRVSAVGQETQLGDMMRALAQAQASKAPIARLADQVSAFFVPAVGAVSVLTFAATYYLSGGDAAAALIHAVAVLVAACPCALGLAAPAAVMAGLGVAARHGIRFKDAAALEAAAGTRIVVFDKTGTLTAGRPTVAGVWPTAGGEDRLWAAAAAVAQYSSHPLSQALLRAARERGVAAEAAQDLVEESGRGIVGRTAAFGTVRLGSPEYCGLGLPEQALRQWPSATWVAAVSEAGCAGLFALADRLHEDSPSAVARLRQLGWSVWILSGDRTAAVEEAARALAADGARGHCSPRDKAAAVAAWQREGKKVALVGDGINDAAALAAADVGLAMGGGTEAAAQAASAVLTGHTPMQAVQALLIARATVANIRQNLFFSLFYNVLCIPLAAFGLLTPVWAGAAMALSSVSVIANALRLQRLKV